MAKKKPKKTVDEASKEIEKLKTGSVYDPKKAKGLGIVPTESKPPKLEL